MPRLCWSLAVSSTDDANGPRTPAVQTYVVGSLPRPRWLFDVLEQERSGILSATKAASYMDEAIISAIRLQDEPVSMSFPTVSGAAATSRPSWLTALTAVRIGRYRVDPSSCRWSSAASRRESRSCESPSDHLGVRDGSGSRSCESPSDHLGVRLERSVLPTDKTLGYGAISRANDDAETVTVVVERIERALGFLPPERLTVNPDCGLAPTAKRTSGSTLDDAYDRLSILCAAARAVRETKRWR